MKISSSQDFISSDRRCPKPLINLNEAHKIPFYHRYQYLPGILPPSILNFSVVVSWNVFDLSLHPTLVWGT
ncbi:hypothetical protein GDO81_000325 [Engystomops pustulosus]|uniref:Uncharacterized protein n=1 Tax=Engystomops pustulosus TaxID=76066 RepID=A0AAV7D3T2_ENGPU|nr:hypothetical protein GDO81_000325 [Engystomops pustulosus]